MMQHSLQKFWVLHAVMFVAKEDIKDISVFVSKTIILVIVDIIRDHYN